MTQRYYIRGRSIDGTVYAALGGWCSDKRDALKLSEEDGNHIIESQRRRNKSSGPDEMIGHLILVKADQQWMVLVWSPYDWDVKHLFGPFDDRSAADNWAGRYRTSVADECATVYEVETPA